MTSELGTYLSADAWPPVHGGLINTTELLPVQLCKTNYTVTTRHVLMGPVKLLTF